MGVGKLVGKDEVVQEVPLILPVPQRVLRVGTQGETVVVGTVEVSADNAFLRRITS